MYAGISIGGWSGVLFGGRGGHWESGIKEREWERCGEHKTLGIGDEDWLLKLNEDHFKRKISFFGFLNKIQKKSSINIHATLLYIMQSKLNFERIHHWSLIYIG